MKKIILKILTLFLLSFYLTLFYPVYCQIIAQTTTDNNRQENPEKIVQNQSYPVTLDGEELFTIQNEFGPISAQERARNINEKLKEIAEDPLFIVDSIKTAKQDNLTFIYAGQLGGDTIILTITEADIEKSGLLKEELIEIYVFKIKEAISTYAKSRESTNILQGIFYTIITVLILVIVLFLINFTFNYINSSLNNSYSTLSGITIRGIQILTGERLTNILKALSRNSQFLLNLTTLVIAITLILGFFPATKKIGLRVWTYCFNSLTLIVQNFIDYLPNLFIIFVFILLTSYFLRFIKPIFDEVEKGSLSIPQFYPEWAEPTYRLIELFIFLLSQLL